MEIYKVAIVCEGRHERGACLRLDTTIVSSNVLLYFALDLTAVSRFSVRSSEAFRESGGGCPSFDDGGTWCWCWNWHWQESLHRLQHVDRTFGSPTYLSPSPPRRLLLALLYPLDARRPTFPEHRSSCLSIHNSLIGRVGKEGVLRLALFEVDRLSSLSFPFLSFPFSPPLRHCPP